MRVVIMPGRVLRRTLAGTLRPRKWLRHSPCTDSTLLKLAFRAEVISEGRTDLRTLVGAKLVFRQVLIAAMTPYRVTPLILLITEVGTFYWAGLKFPGNRLLIAWATAVWCGMWTTELVRWAMPYLLDLLLGVTAARVLLNPMHLVVILWAGIEKAMLRLRKILVLLLLVLLPQLPFTFLLNGWTLEWVMILLRQCLVTLLLGMRPLLALH